MQVSLRIYVEGGGEMGTKKKKAKTKPKKNMGPIVSGKKGKK